MTDEPVLELVHDAEDDEVPPPTPLQRAVREALEPVVKAWDERSKDMLDVLAEASDAKHQVRRAVRTIERVSWLGLGILLVTAYSLWLVLERERTARREFRETEQVRRLEAAQMVIEAGREDVRRATALVREACPNR